MGSHRVIYPDLSAIAAGETLEIAGEEAHHAVRVKRLGAGDKIVLVDGRGTVGAGGVRACRKRGGDWVLELVLERVERREPEKPALRVLAASPKGDRLAEMIDGLSQAGAALWSPLQSERTVVEPREGKLVRLNRIAAESMKQCGRAWVMEIGEPVSLEDSLSRPGLVVADASGEPYTRSGLAEITLLVGPEGGWAAGELERVTRAGARLACFGRHVLRTEMAAVVGAAILMERERGVQGG